MLEPKDPTLILTRPDASTIVMTERAPKPVYDLATITGAPFTGVEIAPYSSDDGGEFPQLRILVPDSSVGDKSPLNQDLWHAEMPDGSSVSGRKLAEVVVGDMKNPEHQARYLVIQGSRLTEDLSKVGQDRFTKKNSVFVVGQAPDSRFVDVVRLKEGSASTVGRDFRGGTRTPGGIAMPVRVSRRAADFSYETVSHEGHPAKILTINSTSLNGMRILAKFNHSENELQPRTDDTKRRRSVAQLAGRILASRKR